MATQEGDLSALELNEEDILHGARAVNPNITIEELIQLAQDPEILDKIRNATEFKLSS